jgi:hypothetical protein
MKIRFLMLIGLVLIVPVTAGAVGVAVNPAEVSIRAIVGEKTTARIKVSNPSTDVAVFEVYPDDLTTFIRIIPSSFTLESAAEKYVTIEVSAPQSGQVQTLLSVVARPLSGNAFAAGSGIKVPLNIVAKEGPSGLASALGTVGTSPWTGIIALGALIGWGLYRRRGKIEVTPKI